MYFGEFQDLRNPNMPNSHDFDQYEGYYSKFQVTILCDKEAVNPADSLKGLLTGLGVDVTTVNEFTDIRVDSELVVVLQAEKCGEAFNTYAMEKGITWLPVQFSHSTGRIGPIIVPGYSACYECAQRRSSSNGLAPLEPKNDMFDLSWSVLSGVIAIETAKWISRHTSSFPPLSLGHMIDLDAFHLQGEVNPIYKLPTCPSCGTRNQARLGVQPWRESDLVLGQ